MPVFSKDKSKYRMVLYVRDDYISRFSKLLGSKQNMYVEYSVIMLDGRKTGHTDKGLQRLIARVENNFRGMYITALIYETTNNTLLHKWLNDKQIL